MEVLTNNDEKGACPGPSQSYSYRPAVRIPARFDHVVKGRLTLSGSGLASWVRIWSDTVDGQRFRAKLSRNAVVRRFHLLRPVRRIFPSRRTFRRPGE